MDTAELKGKNRNISAYSYFLLSEDEKEKIKELLICDCCQEKAFFRNKSSDGKSECFTATHKAGCENSSSGTGRDKLGEIEENKLETSKYFEMQFSDYVEYKKDDKIEDDEANDTDKNEEWYNKRRYTKEPVKEVTRKINLKTILKYAEKGIFDTEKILVNIDGFKYNLGKITHSGETFSGNNNNKYGFYWGEIKSTDMKNWLNFHVNDIEKFAIKIDDKIAKKFFRRFKLKEERSIKIKLPVICCGFTTHSKAGKPYINIKDLKNIYVRMSKLEKL